MLIVLTGAVPTYKRTLANAIKVALNTITLSNGYTLKYFNDYFEINDSGDNIVYGEETDALLKNEDGSANADGAAILNEAQDKIAELFQVNAWKNHFEDIFVDLDYDLGVTTTKNNYTDRVREDRLIPHSYSDIITNYTNRLTDTHVITGIFANWILEDLRTDIGADNIRVINLQRNPSSAYWAWLKDSAQWDDAEFSESVDESIDQTASDTDEGQYEYWIKGILMSNKTAELDWVQTTKFEDIMTTGLTVNGTAITLPAGMSSFNGAISVYENEFIKDRNGAVASDITALNSKINPFDFYTNFPTDLTLDENAFLNSISDINSHFPSNVFGSLGYTALTYDQITSSSS
jgi:hypothetical protein